MASILVDVDGTLIDSYPGIRAGFIRGMEALGLEVPGEDFLRKIPGPPMRDSFAAAGLSAAEVERAMQAYSDYMSSVGWREFTVFPGVGELLKGWKALGLHICTATSKSERFARLALEDAELMPHVDFLGAANHEVGRATKIEVIEYVLAHASPSHPLMVGDRMHDFDGAAHFGLPSVAVTWGYGDEGEWARATHVARTPEELDAIVRTHAAH